MNWVGHRWVWQLESPMHVGIPSAGFLNRTRLFVPARTIWGALTSELARSRNASYPDYRAVGEQLQNEIRLSYLFPAEVVNGNWLAWLPEYCEGKGLVWRREDGDGPVEDRVFRTWLLTIRAGTAIDPLSGAAHDGSLREYEVVRPWSCFSQEECPPRPVGFVGYVFFSDLGAENLPLYEELADVAQMHIGGDTRYGLGGWKKVAFDRLLPLDPRMFGEKLTLQAVNPVVATSRVLAHIPVHTNSKTDCEFSGSLEYLAGWDAGAYGNIKSFGQAWVPGSRVRGVQCFHIQEDGLWQMAETG